MCKLCLYKLLQMGRVDGANMHFTQGNMCYLSCWPTPAQVVVPLSRSVDAKAVGDLLCEACKRDSEGEPLLEEDTKGISFSEYATTVL